VDDKLEEMDAKKGDEVKIYGNSFEWIPRE
jgi:hypothetical protein